MPYELVFNVSAAKEWKKLDPNIQSQFAKKLTERLENPHVPASRLHNLQDCYKIKLRSLGYRLVYQVKDKTVTVTVVAVGRRDGNDVYAEASKRQ